LVKVAQRFSAIPSSAINELVDNINNKVPSINEILTKIIYSANDAKVVTVTKLLMNLSPN
jgi:hypothetical protein